MPERRREHQTKKRQEEIFPDHHLSPELQSDNPTSKHAYGPSTCCLNLESGPRPPWPLTGGDDAGQVISAPRGRLQCQYQMDPTPEGWVVVRVISGDKLPLRELGRVAQVKSRNALT